MPNDLCITGNLGRDPEMRYTPEGRAVTSFSLANNRVWYDKAGNKVTRTTWYRVSVWGTQAERHNNILSQGDNVTVSGRLEPDPDTGRPRIWTRSDGTPAADYEVTAWRIEYHKIKKWQNGQAVEPEPQADEYPF